MADPAGSAERTEPTSSASELLYVSWGGTGRSATVREALVRAGESGREMVYLAILDDATFGDLEPALLDLAQEELGWMLDAQLDLTRTQADLGGVPVRVLVRVGDVADRIEEAAEAAAVGQVLIGAPRPTDTTVVQLVAELQDRLDTPVEIVQP